MKIPCQQIENDLSKLLEKRSREIYVKRKPPKVALFYVGKHNLTDIFIQKKINYAKKFQVKIEVFHYLKPPLFQSFASDLRKIAHNKEFSAVILQQPMPAELCSETLINFIPDLKEVEGEKYKTPFFSPVGLTTLSILKYINTNFKKWEIKKTDPEYFKKNFKKKFIVLAGRGRTTGIPIAKTLVRFKMAMVITHSQTPEPDLFYRQADIIISSTGESILHKGNIKSNNILINFGYHQQENKTKGDYDDGDIADKAGFYTPTIGGTGPIMLSYLMQNILESYAKQVK